MKMSLIVLISLLLSPIMAFAAWEAKVVDVYDGCTLILSDDGRADIIQLYGVECPEQEQPFCLRAKDYSRNMVVGKDISIVTIDDTKRYQRCMVYVEGKCLNEELLKAGYAWHDNRYSSDENWTEFENTAFVQGMGLWSQEDPMPPWEFRGEEDQQSTFRRVYTIKFGGQHETGPSSFSRPPVKRKAEIGSGTRRPSQQKAGTGSGTRRPSQRKAGTGSSTTPPSNLRIFN